MCVVRSVDRARRWAVVGLIVVSLAGAGCADETNKERTTETTGADASGPLISQGTNTTSPPSTAQDDETMRAFVEFAADPGPDSAALVPFADDVSLGLGHTLHVDREVDELSEAAAWLIEIRSGGFRGFDGPFSAIETVSKAGADATVVSVGPHPHCASPSVPPPEEVVDLRRVSLQPAPQSFDTCLGWWTVDLYLTPDGEVAAVTLDLWEA